MIRQYRKADRRWVQALYKREVLDQPWIWDSSVQPLGAFGDMWDVFVDDARRGFIAGRVYGDQPEIELWIVDSSLEPLIKAVVTGRLVYRLIKHWHDQGYVEGRGSVPKDSPLAAFMEKLGSRVIDLGMGRVELRETARFLEAHRDKFEEWAVGS